MSAVERERIDIASLYLQEIGKNSSAAEPRTERSDGSDGKDAWLAMVKANLPLVVYLVRNYLGRGVEFLDLVQEGNLGLMRAAEKYNEQGYKFSTYATWWIKHKITRALANHSRTIRIPVYKDKLVGQLIEASERLRQDLGREPAPEEIGEKIGLTSGQAGEIFGIIQEPISLQELMGENDDSFLSDFIPDREAINPEGAAIFSDLIDRLWQNLTEHEREVLNLRFGLKDGEELSLRQVGQRLGITSEAARQSEKKALKKLSELFK